MQQVKEGPRMCVFLQKQLLCGFSPRWRRGKGEGEESELKLDSKGLPLGEEKGGRGHDGMAKCAATRPKRGGQYSTVKATGCHRSAYLR